MTRIRLRLLPRHFEAARRNKAGDYLIALAMNDQFGGKWTAGPRCAEQAGTGRRMRFGWDARRAMTWLGVARTSRGRHRLVTVTLHEEGRHTGKGLVL